jgi:hypothetical protein
MSARSAVLSALLGIAVLSMFKENISLKIYRPDSEMDRFAALEELQRENKALLQEILDLKKKHAERDGGIAPRG